MNCIKGEIHNVLSMMRVNARWASHDRFRQEIPSSTQSPLMRAFKQLHFELQTVTDLTDVDTVTYLFPFIMVIESDKTSGFITGAAISSLNKFLLYRFVTNESVRADVAMNRIALCISRCRFEETSRADDEGVLMKLLELVEYCIRSDAAHLLTSENVWKMIQLCYSIRCQPRSSPHLGRAAENTLAHVIMTVFDRIREMENSIDIQNGPSNAIQSTKKRAQKEKAYGIELLERILHFLARLLSPDMNEGSDTTCILGLRLINIVLETAGTALGNHSCLVSVLQGDLSKYLLQNSETEELSVLSLVLRVVFNLFNSIKNHLKVQLEIFFTSVHMRIIDSPSCSDDQKELALESLLEFCREPALVLDLYINYDCDVHCTNLFEVLCFSLAKNCQAMEVNGRLNALALLCLEGLLAVVESIARRCPVPLPLEHQDIRVNKKQGSLLGHPSNIMALRGDELAKYASGAQHLVHSNAEVSASGAYTTGSHTDLTRFQTSPNSSPGLHGRPASSSPPHMSLSTADLQMNDISSMSSVNDLMQMVMSSTSSDSDSESDAENRAMIGDQLAWLHSAREKTAKVLQQRKRAKKRYALAAEKFNTDPKHWIEYAQQIELLPEDLTVESVAAFLLHTPGLNKTMIGDYLGEGPEDKYPFNAAVRKAYVSMFDFCDSQSLDEALRMFLAKFRLPGEAQKIDRMMESFSKHFFEQRGNDGPLRDADAAYVLSFSIIMLNTDLHNDQVAKKMTLNEFLRNNRGINAGEDLPSEYLTALYERIRENQIQMQHDVSDLMGSSADLSVVDRYSTSWDGVLKRSENVVGASFTSNASILKLRAGTYEKEMFTLIAEKTIQSILLAYEKTCDITNMERALEGLSNCAKIAMYFELLDVFNRIMCSLATFFLRFAHGVMNGERVYVISSKANSDSTGTNMAQWTSSFHPLSDDEQAEEKIAVRKGSVDTAAPESVRDSTSDNTETQAFHPSLDLLETEGNSASGSNNAAVNHEDYLSNARLRRALLSLLLLFQFVHVRNNYFRKAWTSVIECILMFNELGVIPDSLAEIDEFVDARGVPLPPIHAHITDTDAIATGRIRNQSRLSIERQAATRNRIRNAQNGSMETVSSSLPPNKLAQASSTQGGFWDSLSSYLFAESDNFDETYTLVSRVLGDTITKLGNGILEKKNWLQMVRKLQTKSLMSLLDVLLSCRDPYKCIVHKQQENVDTMLQDNAILALELSVDLILTNAHRLLTLNLWESFHIYAKRILSTPLQDMPMNALVERVIVHILRVNIRLFHDEKTRPKLMETLQLLLTIDENIYAAVSDRLACGINMLLKANLVYLSKNFKEWHVLLSILDNVMQYPNARVSCWDTLKLLIKGNHVNDDNLTLCIAICLRFVSQRTSYAVDALRLLQSLIREDSLFVVNEKTWLDIMRVMLSYLNDDRVQVAKTAWECLYNSLLLPTISVSKETWVQCFTEDLFALDDQLALGAWKENHSEGVLYCITLLSKTFLHHMQTLSESNTFQSLWIDIINRIGSKIRMPNVDMTESSLHEACDALVVIHETAWQSLCNLVTVMQSENVLDQALCEQVKSSMLEENSLCMTLKDATCQVLDQYSEELKFHLGLAMKNGQEDLCKAIENLAKYDFDASECVDKTEIKIETALNSIDVCKEKQSRISAPHYHTGHAILPEEVSEAV